MHGCRMDSIEWRRMVMIAFPMIVSAGVLDVILPISRSST